MILCPTATTPPAPIMPVLAETAAPDAHVIELDTQKDSRITNVNLYSSKAEVSRLYKFDVVAGANRLVISSLPNALENDTLRVEGRGSGTIHDVSVVYAQPVIPLTTSDVLTSLNAKKEEHQLAIGRCKRCLEGLEKYLDTLNVQHVDVTQLSTIMENYETTTKTFEMRIIALEKEFLEIENEIAAERVRLHGQRTTNSELRTVATIGFFAEEDGEVGIQLTYVVGCATWSATYDIRVSTEAKETPVHIVYKASITQSTGETWTNVPLTLETATPTFGVALPSITPWKLSIYKPPVTPKANNLNTFKQRVVSALGVEKDSEEFDDSSDDGVDYPDSDTPSYSFAQVTSKGDLSATYLVPGPVTVLSGGSKHNFTIREFDLFGQLTWISIPKHDTRTRLTAKVHNNSQFTLIPGKANVYVDGSFISTINLPLVGPGEVFTCPLGIDQSIRTVYHPRLSKETKTGFYGKTSTTVFSQRITVYNTKLVPVDGLTVIEQIPVSEDSQITVSLKSPDLTPKPAAPGEPKVVPCAEIEDGVIASWHHPVDGGDVDALGKDGMLKWLCSLRPQTKVNLHLQWEVTSPSQATVAALHDHGVNYGSDGAY